MEKYSELDFGNPKWFSVKEFRTAKVDAAQTSRISTTGMRYDEILLGQNINPTLVFGQLLPNPRWYHPTS